MVAAQESCDAEAIIIGGGIGGLAVAVALQDRGVRCLVYERDESWEVARRGYGLTLGPTCSTALASLGLTHAIRATDMQASSNCHWVFAADGRVLGYFGICFSGKPGDGRNFRVPRHTLRQLLYERLAPGTVRWGWRLRRYEEQPAKRRVAVHLERVGRAAGERAHDRPPPPPEPEPQPPELHVAYGSVLIGADGVRSAVRAQKVGDALREVGVVVVLGLSTTQHPLLHRQGFYTVDGTHRLFTMPYEPLEDAKGSSDATDDAAALERATTDSVPDTAPAAEVAAQAPLCNQPPSTSQPPLFADEGPPHTTMWQLSFRAEDAEAARALCRAGGAALLAEMKARCKLWHAPVPQMLDETLASSVWGTPLLDRPALPLRRKTSVASKGDVASEGAVAGEGAVARAASAWHSRVTLLGDAAHAMTPFKGQGANQTLVDACLLAKCVAAALLADAAAPPDPRDRPRDHPRDHPREDARDAHDDASVRYDASAVPSACDAHDDARVRYDASADRRLSALGTALGRFEREMGDRAEPKVVA